MPSLTAALAAVVAAGALLSASASPDASTPLLVVLNKSDDEAALVDPSSYEVVDRLPTGAGPHEVAISPDGRLAWVSDYGTGESPGHTLTVLDLVERRVDATVDLGSYTRPHGIAVSADGATVWVTAEGARAVVELDARSRAIRTVWRTDQNVSHMVVPTPDERKLYVANIGSGSVSVVDREAGTVTSVPTGAGAEGIDVTPDGSEVWVTNRGEGTISILDVSADTVLATFESGGEVPIRVKISPDGGEAWVSNAGSSTVTVFRVADRALEATLDVGAVPVGVLITPDGGRAFVANTRDDRVTVFDVAARETVGSFRPGNEPDGMAYVRVPAPRADPADVSSIDAIVRALYDVISGPAGERDWSRFRSLFAPGARLAPAAPGPDGAAPLRSIGVEEYVRGAGAYFRENAFHERETARREERFGNVANVMSAYDSRRAPDEEPFARGVNSITLVHAEGRWWVVSIAWDEARPGLEIPAY